MKVIVNYDLLDKVREAKIGISFNRCAKTVGCVEGILIPLRAWGGYMGNETPLETSLAILYFFTLCVGQVGLTAWGNSDFNKKEAVRQLKTLSGSLSDICIETDVELLMDAYQYETEYNVNFDSFPPKLEQKKYIMVPVNNDWGNNERSLVQEHVVGSREFILSYGEPEKKKVYSYGTRKMISK